MVKGSLLTLKARSTTVNGGMTRHMASDCTLTAMVQSMRVNGIRTCSTERVLKVGLTDQSLRGNTKREERMVLGSTSGQTEHAMKDSGQTMRSLAMVIMNGRMAASTWDTGKAT